MLLMHNLDVHRKAGIPRRKISSFLAQLLDNEILYSSDSDCEYHITTTVRRIAKVKAEIGQQNTSDDESQCRKRITRSVVKREAAEIDRVVSSVNCTSSCRYCEFIAETEEILHEHTKREHDVADGTEEIHFASECGKEDTMTKHMKLHTPMEDGDEDDYRNDNVDDATDNCDTDDSDVMMNSKTKLTSGFPCNVCSKIYSNKDQILQHFKTFHPNDEEALSDIIDVMDKHDGVGFPCTICSTVYSNRDSLHRHMRKVHQVPNKDSDNKTSQFTCEVCGKVFYRPKCFATHLKKHDATKVEKLRIKNPKKKTHLCSFCGKSYPGSNHLKIHLRIHTGERPFKCQYCDKTFAIKKTWQDHTYSHTGEKPYICPVENCGKRFTHSTGVRQHMQCCHSSEKQFACPHCDKKCSKKTHLEDHIRSHTGERPYECKYCGIRFRLTSTLRIHHRTHTGERPFVCKVCNRGFIKSYGLKQHLKSKRNCLPPSVQPPMMPLEIEQQSQPEQLIDNNSNTTDDVQFHQLLILPSHQVLS